MALSLDIPSFAIIEGNLCRLNRRGTVTKRLHPLGGSVAEFHLLGTDMIVREEASGFLAGMPNLYCINEGLRIVWLAELPSAQESYSTVLGVDPERIVCRSSSGHDHHLDPKTGKLQP